MQIETTINYEDKSILSTVSITLFQPLIIVYNTILHFFFHNSQITIIVSPLLN